MKAIRVSQFGGPEVLKLEEVPDPKPGTGEVLVSIKAVGINPVETYIRTGAYAMKPSLPYTPGADGAGVVEAVGADVSRFKTGDRVYVIGSLTGTYAEKSLSKEASLFPLPERLTFGQGAALGVPYGTAHRSLFNKAHAQKGETVLIHGASGGVGTALIQLAKRAGLIVIGTGGTDEGRKLVKSLGADHVLDHHDKDFGQKLSQMTDGQGVNVIVEMLANMNLGRDLAYLAKRGRIVVVGSRGPVEIDPRNGMGRDADIRFMTLFNASPEDLKEMHGEMAKGLQDGSLKPVVGRELLLKDAPKAHEAVMAPGAHGKIVLVP